MEEDANRRLDKEILRFKTLLRQSANSGRDFSREIQIQKVVLSRLGLSDGDILNLIHDRHGRASIQIAKDRRKDIVGKFREAEAAKRSPASTFPPPPTTASHGAPASVAKAQAVTSVRNTGKTKVEFSIPYGIDNRGKLVHSDHAARGDRYACPACGLPLNNRTDHGRTKVYFCHRPGTSCSLESGRKATAAYLVAKVITEQADLAAQASITVDCRCSWCARVIQQAVPKATFTQARVKERVGTQVWDVVALRGSEPVLAIAIDQIDVIAAELVGESALYWMELLADDIVENPYHWSPSRAHLKPVRCTSCKQKPPNERSS